MKNKIIILVIVILTYSCIDKKETRTYYSNGNIKEQGYVIGSKKNGEWIRYDSLGRKLSLRRYNMDTLVFREFYNNGVLFSQEEMSGEQTKNGITKTFYPSGKLKSVSNFVDGKELGDHISYYENGEKRTEYIVNEDGKSINFHQYYPNGKLSVYADEMRNGEVNVYDSLGNPMIDLLMKDSQVVDTLKMY